jgi:hypothetical protein
MFPEKEFHDSMCKYTSTITVLRKVQENQVALKLNGTHHLLAYADDVNVLGDNIDTTKKTIETLINTSNAVCLEVNIENTMYMMLSHHQNAG